MVHHRHHRRLLTALLAGVFLTVALAWLAMFIPHGPHGYGPPVTEELGLVREPQGHRIWQVERGRNAWHTVVRYWHMQISGLSLMIPLEDYEARAFDLSKLPSRFRPEALTDLNMMAWYRSTGFPFAALSCEVHWERQVSNKDIVYAVRDGIQLPRDRDYEPRALPLRPVWIGFAADVVIWSGAWLLVTWPLLALRSHLRRGRCPECGYPRTGRPASSACPECGKAP